MIVLINVVNNNYNYNSIIIYNNNLINYKINIMKYKFNMKIKTLKLNYYNIKLMN
jgi:hypothetical protein